MYLNKQYVNCVYCVQSYTYQVLQTTEGGGFEIFWLILTKLSKTQISNGILVINDHFTTVGAQYGDGQSE